MPARNRARMRASNAAYRFEAGGSVPSLVGGCVVALAPAETPAEREKTTGVRTGGSDAREW